MTYYELDACPYKLPNPRQFPVQGANISAWDDYPYSFTDSFMADLYVNEKEKDRLDKKVTRHLPKNSLDSLIEQVKENEMLLSEPKKLYEQGYYISYVLEISEHLVAGMQVKYFRYFRNRYPKCSFLSCDDISSVKSVVSDDKIVGLWMPTIIEGGRNV